MTRRPDSDWIIDVTLSKFLLKWIPTKISQTLKHSAEIYITSAIFHSATKRIAYRPFKIGWFWVLLEVNTEKNGIVI